MGSGWQPVAMPELFAQIVHWGLGLPHCRALGLQLESAGLGKASLTLPFKPELIGNPSTGILHGGVVTSLSDMAGAIAVYTLLDKKESLATLDLRIDYLRPGVPDEALSCQAECYRLTNQIAFTRCTLYQKDEQAPVAHAVATYMRTALPGEEKR